MLAIGEYKPQIICLSTILFSEHIILPVYYAFHTIYGDIPIARISLLGECKEHDLWSQTDMGLNAGSAIDCDIWKLLVTTWLVFMTTNKANNTLFVVSQWHGKDERI